MSESEIIQTTVKITMNLKVTPQDVENILSGCFEGGSGDWIEDVRVDGYEAGVKPMCEWAAQALSEKRDVFIYVDEDDPYALSWTGMMGGIIMFANEYAPCRSYPCFEYDDGLRLDLGSMDADDCDVILQLALFGEVRYS